MVSDRNERIDNLDKISLRGADIEHRLSEFYIDLTKGISDHKTPRLQLFECNAWEHAALRAIKQVFGEPSEEILRWTQIDQQQADDLSARSFDQRNFVARYLHYFGKRLELIKEYALLEPSKGYNKFQEVIYMTHNDQSTHVTITNSPGAISNIAEYMENVSNYVNQNMNTATASDEVKNLVKQLAVDIAAISSLLDPTKAKEIGSDLKTLSDEVAKPKPRRAWYELTLKGIKEVASTIGEIAKPVLETVSKLMALLIPT